MSCALFGYMSIEDWHNGFWGIQTNLERFLIKDWPLENRGLTPVLLCSMWGYAAWHAQFSEDVDRVQELCDKCFVLIPEHHLIVNKGWVEQQAAWAMYSRGAVEEGTLMMQQGMKTFFKVGTLSLITFASSPMLLKVSHN